MSTRDEILIELGISPFWKKSLEGRTRFDAEESVTYTSVSAGEMKSGVLFKSSLHTIVGKGDPEAGWVFIAESPSTQGDDSANSLLLGDASKLFNNMLIAMHLARDKGVYLIDVLQTYSSTEDAIIVNEEGSCKEFLDQQIQLLRPSVIVAMGSAAAKRLMRHHTMLDCPRTVHDYCGFDLVVTDHPLDLLKDSSKKVNAWKDLCFASDLMKGHQEDASVS